MNKFEIIYRKNGTELMRVVDNPLGLTEEEILFDFWLFQNPDEIVLVTEKS